MRSSITVLVGLTVWMGAAQAKPPARDPVAARGEQLARIVCAICHVVADDQEFPPILHSPTPSFREIANRPGTTEQTLRQFLKTTHWDEKTIPMSMPQQMLMDDQTRAVSRYILSLRTP